MPNIRYSIIRFISNRINCILVAMEFYTFCGPRFPSYTRYPVRDIPIPIRHSITNFIMVNQAERLFFYRVYCIDASGKRAICPRSGLLYCIRTSFKNVLLFLLSNFSNVRLHSDMSVVGGVAGQVWSQYISVCTLLL